MLNSIDDIRKTFVECKPTKCKECPLNTNLELIPADLNEGFAVRGSVCDLITAMNNYNVTEISRLLK